MRCKVIKAFIGRDDGKYHAVGTVYECSAERYNEVQAAGNYLAVIVIKEKSAKKAK